MDADGGPILAGLQADGIRTAVGFRWFRQPNSGIPVRTAWRNHGRSIQPATSRDWNSDRVHDSRLHIGRVDAYAQSNGARDIWLAKPTEPNSSPDPVSL